MHRHDRLACLGLVAAVVVFLAPALTGDRVLMTFDVGRWEPWTSTIGPDFERPSFNADGARFVLPRAVQLRRALGAGELPLWDGSAFLGNPFLALWQTHVLYPPAWLLLPLDARTSMAWTVALHLAIAAVGAFALLRSFGLALGAGLAGALAFAFGGATMLRLGHPTFVATLAWLPWTLFAVERFLATRRGRWLAALALGFALLVLAGQATLAVLSGYLLAGWCLAAAGLAGERRGATAAALLLALAAGVLLAAPQLETSAELGARSARADRDVEELDRTAIPAAATVQIVAPEVWGAVRRPPPARLSPPGSPRAGGPSFAASVAGYTGAWIPAFAVLALVAGGAGWRFVGLAAVVLVALLLATGSPLFALAHGVLPGLRFSAINRALPFVGFALALLAARGLHVAAEGQVARARLRAVAAAWAIAALALWIWLRFGAVPAAAAGRSEALVHATAAADRFVVFAWLGALAMAAAPAAWGRAGARRLWWVAVVLLLAVELAGFAWPHRVLRPRARVLPETPALAWLQEHGEGRRVVRFLPRRADDATFVQGSALSVFGLREVGGFAPLHPDATNRFLERAGWERTSAWRVGALSDPAALGSPLFGLLAAPWILAPPGVPVPGAEKVHESDLAVWRAPGALPEAFVAGETLAVPGLEAALRALTRPGFDPRRTATVEAAEAPALGGTPPSSARAEVRERRTNRIVVDVESDGAGWLIVSEAWAPGWQVRRDGGPAQAVRPTDGIFLGAAVGPGSHAVAFEYRPRSLRLGAMLAFAGAALLAGLVRFAR